MASRKTREARETVNIWARLRHQAGISDAVIRDVSEHGLMVACPTLPACGEYVELRYGSELVIAEVMWRREDRFGARVCDRLDCRGIEPLLRRIEKRLLGEAAAS